MRIFNLDEVKESFNPQRGGYKLLNTHTLPSCKDRFNPQRGGYKQRWQERLFVVLAVFQSPKGRLQTKDVYTNVELNKDCFNPQRGGYKPL